MTRISLRIAATLVTLTAALPVAAEAPLPLAVEFRAVSTMDRASPATPQLTSINYERLYRRLVQAGMISQVLGYTLTVDAEGDTGKSLVLLRETGLDAAMITAILAGFDRGWLRSMGAAFMTALMRLCAASAATPGTSHRAPR